MGAGLGVARQEQDCRELAHRLGWRVTQVYTDNDLSAYSGKPRPGYRRLLADLDAGRIDAVICWHPDRLHRSPVELEHYITVRAAVGAYARCQGRGAGPVHPVREDGGQAARGGGAVRG